MALEGLHASLSINKKLLLPFLNITNNSSLKAPLRFGLVGFGAWGRFHARSIEGSSNAKLVAISVPSSTSQEEAKKEFPEISVYEDYREMFARDDIDIIDIVTPTSEHYAIAKAALTSGKHLLLEKPMAARLNDCSDLENTARAAGLTIAIGHELRLSSQWGQIKQIIDDGIIGDPQYVLVELSRRPYRPGSKGWRFDSERVGSWILEEPIHFFDLARWYLESAGEPVKVYATANARDPKHPELHDNFSCLMNFKNEAYAVVSQTLSAFEHHQTVKVSGTDGAIWAGWSGSKDRTEHPTHFLKVFNGSEVEEWNLGQSSGEVFELRKQIEYVAQSILDNRPPHATGRDGLWSVGMCLGAERSVALGQPVDLTEFMKPYLNT